MNEVSGSAVRYGVIVNPGSGDHAEEDRVAMLRRAFGGDAVEFYVLKHGAGIAELVDRAIDDGASVIVAAGGDGTICGVAEQLTDRDATLGIIPMGTFNFVARGLDIPQEIGPAVEVLRRNRRQGMVVGMVNDRVFLNNASIGLYPHILRNREKIYDRYGRSRLAAMWSVLVTFAGLDSRIRAELVVDGKRETVLSPMIFAARSDYQLQEYELNGGPCVRDGKLAVFLAPNLSRWDLLRRAGRLALRTTKPNQDYRLICCEDLEIHLGRPRSEVARDGERAMLDTPLRLRVRRDALQVIVGEAPT